MRTAARLCLFVLVLLVAVAASCDGGGTASKPAGQVPVSVPFTTLAQTGVPGQTGDTIREVIRDAEAWSRVWPKLQTGSALPAAPPEIDFHHEMVIVAAMPTQSCVSKVTIRSISGSGGGLRVEILEQPPGSNCICITTQRPFHIVRLPHSDAAVDFAVTTTPKVC